jgi:uncharacterized protein (DUF1800 family)
MVEGVIMLRISVVAVLLPLALWAADPPASQRTKLINDSAVNNGAVNGIQVHFGSTVVPGSSGIANRTGSADLGTAMVAKSKPAIFTVRNSGKTAITLTDPIRLPRGFTLVKSFGAHKLSPGETTRFVIALNSARAGQLSGQLSFGTSASPGNRFSLTVTGNALAPPSMRIVDNSDPDFRAVGRWSVVTGQGLRGTAHVSSADQGINRALWTFSGLQAGLYQVSATWPASGAASAPRGSSGDASASRATNARFNIVNGTKALATVPVNQSARDGDFRDGGAIWHNLGGPLRISGDRLEVWLSSQANGSVVADAVRVERIGLPGRIVTTSDKSFQSVGGWVRNNAQALVASTDQSSATWNFTGLIPGHYRISTTWPVQTRGAAAAPFTIFDGDRTVATVALNQQVTPSDLRDAGSTWADLGGLGHLFTIRGRSLSVRLSTPSGSIGTGNAVVASDVRVERIYDPAGGDGSGPLINMPDIVRLLEQSTWGPNDTSIAHVQNDLSGDPNAFLAEQFSAPISSYADPPLVLDNQGNQCNNDSICNRDNYSLYIPQNRFFTNAMYKPDQLRQRVAFALHEVDVVSGLQTNMPLRFVPYLKIFDQNAFGNYRDILYKITLNPAMGNYLNMLNSTKSNPNENYGREIMQLFSIGLDMLNPDGTVQYDNNGNPIPTYTQDTINNFARVFTGWILAPPLGNGISNYIDPMVPRTPEGSYHDQGAKTLLQYQNAHYPNLPAGQSAMDDLNQALDNIFYHPNVGPFIGKLLIQKLVTSNPSTDYVSRISAVFNDDGTGVRGNLKAVVSAILLDPEARGDMTSDPNFGHLREPMLYTCNLLRAFNATSHDGMTTSDGYINSSITSLGMDLFRPPTVFSYYSPDFNVPGSDTLLGPEFNILTAVTTLKRANFINQMTFGGGINTGTNSPNGTALNLTGLQTMTPDAMADYLNTVLMHGTMSDDMRTALINAINAVAASNPVKRARTAVYLIATSPQYQVQR